MTGAVAPSARLVELRQRRTSVIQLDDVISDLDRLDHAVRTGDAVLAENTRRLTAAVLVHACRQSNTWDVPRSLGSGSQYDLNATVVTLVEQVVAVGGLVERQPMGG